MILPLAGVRVLEFEGIGPGPLAGRMLVELGAEVTVIVKPDATSPGDSGSGELLSLMRRGKSVVTANLKEPDAREAVLALVESMDALIESFRPGVMERLHLGPEDCARRNARLVYGRLTGWGQDGPLARAAGHDLNYVALAGALWLSDPHGGRPQVPPTILGDGTGALALVLGITGGLLSGVRTGNGCVIDSAILDVVSSLSAIALWVHSQGLLAGPRPSIFHDAPFYDVYACADRRFITLCALEPEFYALFLDKVELTDVDPRKQYDAGSWPQLKSRLRALFASKPRDHWCALLEGTDVCFAPVLTLEEAARHPQNTARGVHRRGPDGRHDVGLSTSRFSPLPRSDADGSPG